MFDFGLYLACKGNEIYFAFMDADWGCDLDSRSQPQECYIN